jgi:6-phosphofructokinase 1
VVVAEGAQFFELPPEPAVGAPVDDEDGPCVVPGPGRVGEMVADRLRARIDGEITSLVIGPWARGGNPTAVDQQLGMAYGASAIQALKAGRNGMLVAFVPPEIRLVPLADAVGKVRTVPRDSEFMRIAGSLGIYLGTGL